MTTCYDSTTPSQIPADAPIVAGYIDGLYAWKPADWARFSGQHVTITVFGAAGAQVADVERGDLTPQQGADWARRELAAGRRPTIYSDRSTWPTVVGLLGAEARLVSWWAADPTGTPHLVPGSACTQYAWNQLGQTGGKNVDISVTNGVWPGTITPVPPTPSAPKKPVAVAIEACSTGGYWIAAADGGVFAYGGAPFHGSLGGKTLSAPIVDIAASGAGYYLVGADGAVYAFNCTYYGGTNQ
jgi:hypothetical protein